MIEPLIFDLHKPAVRCGYIPPSDIPDEISGPPSQYCRSGLDLPQVAEPEVVRHFIRLSVLNHHVDKGFYPLGSCTMKYNPKVNETLSQLPGFAGIHPLQPEETVQGALWVMWELERVLSIITGLDEVTLQPAAGSHGELTGLFLTRAYHSANGELRRKVLIPDSAHGTNPASITMAGFQAVSIPSDQRGRIDLNALTQALSPDVAALMITNPNTLGLFEDQLDRIVEEVHRVGAILYMDGANLNALVGLTRPGDIGFDIVHINLHKTFSTPHGGGGPGAGPLAVHRKLSPFLPVPRLTKREDGALGWDWDRPQSIGKVSSFYGNFGMFVRALAYIYALGREGLEKVSQTAILNANYLRARLQQVYKLPYPDFCAHEVVFSADHQAERGVKALDIAKRLLDFGLHAPTIYFPLIVHEALMIEPTETETLETLDRFVETMLLIDEESKHSSDQLRIAPHSTPVSRLDEAWAAKNLDVCSLYTLGKGC